MQGAQVVAEGADFQDEVGGAWEYGVPFRIGGGIVAFLRDPGGVGAAHCAGGQAKTAGLGSVDAAIFQLPDAQMDIRVGFPQAAFESNHRQNHQFAGFVDFHFVMVVFRAEVNKAGREIGGVPVNAQWRQAKADGAGGFGARVRIRPGGGVSNGVGRRAVPQRRDGEAVAQWR